MLNPDNLTLKLQEDFNKLPDTKEKVWHYIETVMNYSDSLGIKLNDLRNDARLLCKKLNYKEGDFICDYMHNYIGLLTQGNAYPSNYLDNDTLLEKLKNDDEAICTVLTLNAYNFWFKGEYETAFKTLFKIFQLNLNVRDLAMAWVYYALAIFYYDTKDIVSSEENLTKALNLFNKQNYQYGIARVSNARAANFMYRKKFDEASEHLHTAESIFRSLSHYAGLSRSLNDLGILEKNNGDPQKAIDRLNESLQYRKQLNHIQGLITTYTELGELFLELHEIEKARKAFDEAMHLIGEKGSKQKRIRLLKLYYQLHKKEGDLKNALHYFEQFTEAQSELLSDETSVNIKRMVTSFEKEKSEKIAEVERKKNLELKEAYSLIEHKNKEILDSINYAKRIQMLQIPTEKAFENSLNRARKTQ